MLSTKELEEYIRGVLGVPLVQLDDIEKEVGNVIVEELEKMVRNYPLLKYFLHSIVFLEQAKRIKGYRTYHLKSLFFGSVFLKKNDVYTEGIVLGDRIKYSSLEILDHLANTEIHAKGCRSLKGHFYHVIGHTLDDLLKITTSMNFYEFCEKYEIKQKNIEKNISWMASISPQELLAESFAEFYGNESPHPFVYLLMEYVQKKYENFSKSEEALKLIYRKKGEGKNGII